MSIKSGYIMVMTTVASRKDAGALAGKVISGRLAACVQQMPVRSVYRWKGRVESSDEFLLMMKTRAGLKEKLFRYIKSVHPYEVPEIIAVPVSAGFRGYLDWIDKSVRSG